MKYSIPNVDAHPEPFTIIPKEVMQKAYLDKVGSFINICGEPRKLIDVEITDNFITLIFEEKISLDEFKTQLRVLGRRNK